MSASENKVQRRPQVVSGVSMRDLLAAGVAANVISTPPRRSAGGAVRPSVVCGPAVAGRAVPRAPGDVAEPRPTPPPKLS